MRLLKLKSSGPLAPEVFQKCLEEFINRYKFLPPTEVKYKHTLMDGMYFREFFIPANTFVIGAVHLKETAAILSVGSMRYLGVEGVSDISAHKLIISPPGIQRAAVTLTDVVFTTIHRTDLTDLKDIEDELVDGGSEILYGGAKNKQLIENRRLANERNKSISAKLDRAGLL